MFELCSFRSCFFWFFCLPVSRTGCCSFELNFNRVQFSLFIYRLFNDIASMSRCIAFNDRWLVNNAEGIGHGLIWDTVLLVDWKYWEMPLKIPVRLFVVMAGVSSGNLSAQKYKMPAHIQLTRQCFISAVT